MYKCLKVVIKAAVFPEGFLHDFVQKNARKCSLEGTAHTAEAAKQVVVILCGQSENIDLFLDIMHKGAGKWMPEQIEVEPFLKEKDYRGVFRIIE
jgi:acylphosphatase